MRFVRLIIGAAWILAVSVNAQAGPVPYQATVVVPEVEVRSLPSGSANSYPTSKLRQGSIVEVVEEKEGGWLAIKPPAGSFSWVQTRFLERPYPNAPSGVILGDGVEVRLGSSVVDRKPDVFQVRLQRGAQVVILNQPKAYDDETGGWVTIQPPEKEVRFIPAEAVKPAGPVQTVSSAPPGGTPVFPGGQLTGSGAPSADSAATSHLHAPVEDPLWLQAKQAEREGKFVEAENLYLQLAKQTTDHDLCIRCYNHIHYLKQRVQPIPAAGTANVPAATSAYPVAGGENRLVPTPAIPYPPVVKSAPTATGQATSQYTYLREPASPAGGPAQAQTSAVVTNPPAAASMIGPGLLVRAASPVAGQQGYMLDRGKDLPIYFVLPSPGVNLDRFANTRVSITGTIAYHQWYRREVITATQVVPQP
jgi:hypothetical protein